MNSTHRWLAIGGLFAGAALIAGVVKAGNTYYTDVAFTGTATNGSASGTLTTARRSADSNQSILCAVIADPTAVFLQCTAKNAAGTLRSCTSSAPTMVQAALGMTSYGHLEFFFSNGACTQVRVTNGSRFLP